MSKHKEASQNQNQSHGFGPRGGVGAPVEKAKDFKGTFKRLISYLAPISFNY